jgi:hypothetical protein
MRGARVNDSRWRWRRRRNWGPRFLLGKAFEKVSEVEVAAYMSRSIRAKIGKRIIAVKNATRAMLD